MRMNMIGNPLNCDRIDGQEFNIIRYYHMGRKSKRGVYRKFNLRRSKK